MKNLMVRREKMVEAMTPRVMVVMVCVVQVVWVRPEKVKRVAPKMVGMARRKEILVAWSLGRPAIRRKAIVSPEREMPGRTVMLWTRPRMMAMVQNSFSKQTPSSKN